MTKAELKRAQTQDEPLRPIDPPDNTSTGPSPEASPESDDFSGMPIDPPDNTGGSTSGW